MIQIKELFGDKTFLNKEELFSFVVANEDALKQSTRKSVSYSVNKSGSVGFYEAKNENVCGVEIEKSTMIKPKEGFFYPVINSTMWMDSHLDVHLRGCYNKTVKDQNGKVQLIDSHQKGFHNLIAPPSAVNMLVKEVDWKLLGKNIEGKSECLVFEVDESKVIGKAQIEYARNEKNIECSFAMIYVKSAYAFDSDKPEYAEYKERWDKFYPMIANKEMADKYGVFNCVYELAIVGEGSLMLGGMGKGSNSATVGSITAYAENKDTPEAVDDTSKESVPQEPSDNDTLAKLKSIIDNI